jgi:hypothetical protein
VTYPFREAVRLPRCTCGQYGMPFGVNLLFWKKERRTHRRNAPCYDWERP